LFHSSPFHAWAPRARFDLTALALAALLHVQLASLQSQWTLYKVLGGALQEP
jgi:hypothetical protein